MANLCRFCEGEKRSTCEGQEAWNKGEVKFQSAYERIKKLKEENSTVAGIEAEFKKRKQNMVQERASNARTFQTIANRRGCTLLSILPFAE